MAEAGVHEHNSVVARENEVQSAEQFSPMKAKPESRRMQCPTAISWRASCPLMLAMIRLRTAGLMTSIDQKSAATDLAICTASPGGTAFPT